jgi:hypothetical protein
MQKLMLSGFFTAIAIAIASTTSVMSAKSETMSEYLDNTTPQVIEKISGNIVTFKNVAGESNNYYVPNWMFEKYSLKVGTSANLYNRNITQGIYHGRYIQSQGLPANMGAFALHDIRRNCIISEGMATEGLFSGQKVWFKTDDCPSTIPIVGSMSFYQAGPITAAFKEPETQMEEMSNQ